LAEALDSSKMPEKATAVSYAAGASLAAIALVYVFAPTYFIDGEGAKKKGVVGLRNGANDCFINSVLQALAGLGELRIYLIRELHRRNIDDPAVYETLVQPPGKTIPEWKLEGQQKGIVTHGLKEMLDALNERPLSKKSTTALTFVRVLEQGFRQRISRQQQDAQEFLQIVAERLKDEYHAGQRARKRARDGTKLLTNGQTSQLGGQAVEEKLAGLAIENEVVNGTSQDIPILTRISTTATEKNSIGIEEEEGFPMEGKWESQIECQTCRYSPKPKVETFCTLTLNVPQEQYTSLNACFDGVFKVEYIDDYRCDKCRLVHAKEELEKSLKKSTSDKFKASGEADLQKIQHAIDTDPGKPPLDVELPDTRFAPKRKIAKSTRIVVFPKILAVHLSRSIYDSSQVSQKNSAKVSFPERLPLGGLLDQRKYKLLGLVTHKGSHHSGHYESFRRQNVYPPYSNPNTFQQSEVYSRTGSPSSTPQITAVSKSDSPVVSSPDLLSLSPGTNSSTPSLESSIAQTSLTSDSSGNVRSPSKDRPAPSPLNPMPQTPREKDPDSSSIRSVAASARSTLSRLSGSKKANGITPEKQAKPIATPKSPTPVSRKKKQKNTDKWWRISDERVRDARTSEVLDMQREVYLLFYELEKENAA
jgi:ubiquitin carboxyl-terminal hydrolase 16